MAKEITRGLIAPGAAEIRKNAVPIAQEVKAVTCCSVIAARSTSMYLYCIPGSVFGKLGALEFAVLSSPCIVPDVSNWLAVYLWFAQTRP